MFGIENLWLFVISGIILNILPGPDSLYIVGRSASQGFKAGSLAALGIGTGTFMHILFAALGLSAILTTSAFAFTVVKIIGCIYLLYIGIKMIMSKSSELSEQGLPHARESFAHIFIQGFLTNVLNPKVALFFLAFVPQFISAESDNKFAAFLILGIIFNINGMIWCHLLAWTTASISVRITASPLINRWLTRCVGAMFAYFGIRLALSNQV